MKKLYYVLIIAVALILIGIGTKRNYEYLRVPGPSVETCKEKVNDDVKYWNNFWK